MFSFSFSCVTEKALESLHVFFKTKIPAIAACKSESCL